MIRINKLQEPDTLRDHGAEWTAEFETAQRNGTVTNAMRYRYRHPEIKLRIREETSDKCAYCESKITHTYPGDVEHIVPVSKTPDMILQWENLTLACGECNRRKGDYYDPANPLLNPYTEEPSDHLIAAGALIFGRPGDAKGSFAELRLKLNRAALRERRDERLSSLNNLINRHANEANPDLKALLEDELRREMERDREYVFVSKAFIQLMCTF